MRALIAVSVEQPLSRWVRRCSLPFRPRQLASAASAAAASAASAASAAAAAAVAAILLAVCIYPVRDHSIMGKKTGGHVLTVRSRVGDKGMGDDTWSHGFCPDCPPACPRGILSLKHIGIRVELGRMTEKKINIKTKQNETHLL